MKKFFFILVMIPLTIYAQEETTPKRKIVLGLNNGLWFNTNYDLSNNDWKKMLPDWAYFDSVDNSYGDFNYRSFGANQSNVLSIDFIHPKLSGENFEVSTSIHIGHGQNVSAYESKFKENRIPIDTLISQQTGQAYYVNQLEFISEYRSYNAQFLMIGFGEHFATNPKRRFQFRTGIEAMASLSYKSEVSASYSRDYSYEGFLDYNNPSVQLPESFRVSENTSTDMLTGLVVRVPLDINLCLSQKDNFFNRIRVGAEFNPGLAVIFRNGSVRSNFTAQLATNLKIRL